MNTFAFLSYLRSLGVRLWVDGDRLRYSAPKGTLTPVLRAELAARKADLLSFLHQAHLAVSSTLPPIVPVARDGNLPLSFAQQRLWFLEQLQPEGSAYNIPAALRLQGLLNVSALVQSLREMVRRHDILRTTFPAVDGQPFQVISPDVDFTLPVVDLETLPEDTREAEAQQQAAKMAQQPFNLAHGPLVRVVLLRLAAEHHILLMIVHHIVFDGWSYEVFFQELAALYAAFATGKPSPLPALPIQYVDFAHWQQQWMQGEFLKAQLAYWKQQLGGLTVLALPTDRPRPPLQTFSGARQSLVVPKHLTDALKALSQQEGGTLFMTLLAAFKTLLYRYTGQEDIVVGSPIAGRNRLETEGLVGFFVNTLVLRTDLSGPPTFRELLVQVREVCLGAYAHQDLPFEKLVEALQPERDLSRNPLFETMFTFQNTPQQAVEFAGLNFSFVEVCSATAKFDLTLELQETSEGLKGWFGYRTDLFDAATIARMRDHLQILLESIIAAPEQHLSTLPLLTASERHQLLVAWNATERGYPQARCIHQLFEARVARIPDAIAVVCADGYLNYHELNRRANQVAYHLRGLGVGPEVLVGLCIERSLNMVVGLLGILKAGGAYVPLDPAYPRERLAFMLEDARVSVVLTEERLVASLPDCRVAVVCLDSGWHIIAQYSDQNPVSGAIADDLASVLYTSGSTGRPKGVLGTHRATLNVLAWLWQTFPFAPQEVCCLQTSMSFVDSIQELLAPLLRGIRTILMPDEILQDLPQFVQTLAVHHVTRILLVPSLLQVLLDTNVDLQRRLPSLALWCVSGEVLSQHLCACFFERMPHSRLINLYGASEDTADVTWYDTSLVHHELRSVPIGRPITNTQIYMLDRHLQPVPVGVPGELYVGGVGLARGYLNRPELTAEKFIPNPFSTEPGARLYKTGDLARYLSDGHLEFLGRLDHQIKLRGFRIELGVIEGVLGQHPAVHQAVVLAREDAPGNARLVTYVVPSREPVPTISELHSFLKAKLPEYMVPPAFVLLDSLPLTPNGKVDRHALPAPDQARPELEGAFVAPHTPLELLLAESWQDLLGVDRVSLYDKFFDLGGHSLLSMQVIARVEKQVGLRLHPTDLMFQTLGQLAAACEERMHLLQPVETRSYTQKVFHMIKSVIFQRTGDRK